MRELAAKVGISAPFVSDIESGFRYPSDDVLEQLAKALGTHEGSAAPSSFKPNVFERQRTTMVDGIEIVGAHPEADGIEASGTMQLTITRVAVHEARHGIHFTVRNRNVTISACHRREHA